jgi:hypothetical protein
MDRLGTGGDISRRMDVAFEPGFVMKDDLKKLAS